MIASSIANVIDRAELLIREIELPHPAEKSCEWFAINNLRGFVDVLRTAQTKDDVVNAARDLSRFAVDSLEWGSELMKNVECLAEATRKASQGRT